MTEADKAKMTRRKYLKYGGGIVAAAVVAAAGYGIYEGTKPTPTPTMPTQTPTPTPTLTPTSTSTPTSPITPESWWKEAAKPYAGTTIRWISESTPPSVAIDKATIKDFEDLTGIKVEDELTFYDDVHTKCMMDFNSHTGKYDILYVEIEWLGQYAGANFIYPVEDIMKEHPEIVEPNLDLQDFINLEERKYPVLAPNKLFTVPFETFGYFYWYRKDLFEQYNDEFKQKYGRDLTVPKTFTEYVQIAEFFTRPDQNLYGHIAQAKTHNALECEWELYHQWFGNQRINWDTMRASGSVNTAQAAKTMEIYVDLLKYCPAGVKTYTWDEAGAAMQQGIIAQGPLWADWAMSTWDPSVSKVVGKMAFDVLPYVDDYKGIKTSPNQPRHLGCSSGFGINADSKNKEAALLFAEWCKRKEFEPGWVIDSGVVCRRSSLQTAKLQEADRKYNGLFSAIAKSMEVGFFPLRIKEYAEMKSVAETPLGQIVTGEATAQQGLNKLAKAWDDILIRGGY